ncbi:MAG TPA: Ig-like domain-containing protein [Thermoleophilaceae bacterium]|nr:Ig-like domain-containing protein [Thermoleophilaceae bacterium]
MALLAATAVAGAPRAEAAPQWIEMGSVPGQILDVDPGRILFKQSQSALGIFDRSSQTTTPVAVAGADATEGFLTSHGAIFATVTGSSRRVWELRDGTLVDLGPYGSFRFTLEVAGHFAIWSLDGSAPAPLFRRDLDTATTVTVGNVLAANGPLSGSDLAPNGDVVYFCSSGIDHICRFRSGTNTDIGQPPHTYPYPRTDGTNAAWATRESTEVNGQPQTIDRLEGINALGNPFTVEGLHQPFGDYHYRLAGGRIAVVKSSRVFIRDTDGSETAVSPVSDPNTMDGWALAGFNDAGEVIYRTHIAGQANYFLGKKGANPVPLGVLPSDFEYPGHGYGDYVFPAGSNWYAVIAGSLRRLSLNDGFIDGSETHIVSGPQGDQNGTTATFEFTTTAAGATFECRLDGAAYEACASGKTYTGLDHGQHSFVVRAVKPGGSVETEPASASWAVESTPPNAFDLTAPADGANTRDSTPTLSWEQSSDGGSGIDHYEVRLDGSHAADVNGTTFTFPSALADGVHDWLVIAVDHAGNQRSSPERSFRVDTTRPQSALSASPNPALTGARVTFDASRSKDPGGSGIVRYQWDITGDGKIDRDSGASPHMTATYSSRREIRPSVVVTDAAGNSRRAAVSLSVRPRPPAGRVGITIDHGAVITRDRQVEIGVVWPRNARFVLLSNDGGFTNAKRFPVQRTIGWTLRRGTGKGGSRTVYARFLGGANPNQPYQDDIVWRPASTRAVAQAR